MKIKQKTTGISLLSLTYRIVGNLLIGKPSSLGQKKDFYDIPIDRDMPTPKEASDVYFKENIKTDYIRRKIFLAVGKFTALFSIIFFGALIMIFPYMGYSNPLENVVPEAQSHLSSMLHSDNNQQQFDNQSSSSNSFTHSSHFFN